MRLTLKQLQVFAAIAQGGSTVAAAERLFMSQSAVSAAMSELERSLGTTLYDRAGKRLILNARGRTILSQVLALLDNAETLERAFASDMPVGLKIGASLTIGNYLLPALLAQYGREVGVTWDGVSGSVQISTGSTAEIVQKVIHFEVDIGMVEGHCFDPQIQVVPWREDELVLVASPEYAMQHGLQQEGVPTSRLEQVNWILREPGSGTRETLERFLMPKLIHLRSGLEFSDHEAVKRAAVEGLGVAYLSRSVVAEQIATRQLVEVYSALGTLKRHFYILRHRQKQETPEIQRLIDFLRQ